MSTKVLSVLAIITALCFVVLIALQISELRHFSAEPSVWPAAVQ